MHKIFLDIETLPAGEESHAVLKVLFEKKGKENEEFADFVARTTFDGAFGRILCIGYAVDDAPAENFYNENDEKKTLEQFWNLVKSLSVPKSGYGGMDYGIQFIGHNVMDFDLRFIYQRSIILGVRPSADLGFARYRNYPIYDTMKEWVKWSNGTVGLETLALSMGIPTPKEGIDGSQVAAFFEAGKVKDILEYCKRDVQTTRAVYQRMTFEKPQHKLF